MKRYPEYKESNVEWIGEIPKNWSAVPLTKYLESIIDYRGRTPEKIEEGRFLVTAKNIRNGQIDYEISQEFTSEDEYQRIMTRGMPQIGDVLFTTEAPLGEVANVDDVSIALAQRVIKFRPKSDCLNPYFLKYWILSYSFQSELHQYATGSTAQGIKASKLCLLKLNLPPLKEQAQIADFLDCKTEQIDELIRIKERRIELLQEQRTALINQAVTKGLDPNMEMKPSGVEWIGEIPAHWKIINTKYLFQLVAEPAPQNNDYELLSIYTSIGVKPRKELEERGNRATTTDGYWLVKKGDFIVNKLLAWMGAIGLSDYEGVTSPAYDILRKTRPLNERLYEYLFRCGLYFTEFKKRSRGIMEVRLRLYFDQFGQIPLVFPPVDEQDKIVNFLDHKTEQIDELISAEQQKIELLKEYRQSLISEAVTGKIDVRNEV